LVTVSLISEDSMGDMNMLGSGIPNIYLEKDYNGDEKRWVLRVETTVPLDDEVQVRQWLEKTSSEPTEVVLSDILRQVPNRGGRADAQHMVAAAFGFECDKNGVLKPRPTP
jgi:hypothetical protein